MKSRFRKNRLPSSGCRALFFFLIFCREVYRFLHSKCYLYFSFSLSGCFSAGSWNSNYFVLLFDSLQFLLFFLLMMMKLIFFGSLAGENFVSQFTSFFLSFFLMIKLFLPDSGFVGVKYHSLANDCFEVRSLMQWAAIKIKFRKARFALSTFTNKVFVREKPR